MQQKKLFVFLIGVCLLSGIISINGVNPANNLNRNSIFDNYTDTIEKVDNPSTAISEPMRSEVMYVANSQSSGLKYFNPFDLFTSYLTAFMYEPLFGYNEVTNELIPVIGSTLNWASDGSTITVSINNYAQWSDGHYIDANDIIYSYQLHDANRFMDLLGTNTGDVFSSISYVDSHTILFTLNTPWSYRAFQFLTTEQYILPEHVFSVINATHSVGGRLDSSYGWQNNWFNLSDTPLDWQVCSGPYSPYWLNFTEKKIISQFRPNWWGKNRLYLDVPGYTGVPNIPYLGEYIIIENNVIKERLVNGSIDVSASWITNITEILASDPNIETFYGRSSSDIYLSMGGLIGISMNHLRYPFVEPWFKQMVAYCINYTEVSEVATGGIWKKANTGLINPDSPFMAEFYNATLRNQLEIDYNYAQALTILDDNCYWNGTDWLTNDVPVAMQGMLGTGGVAIVDEDSSTPGFNVKLGGYEINVPLGWTDVEAATGVWAASLSALNISTIRNSEDMMDWVIEADTDNYDMMMQCCGPNLLNDLITFLKDFSNPAYTGAWSYHSTNWMNEAAVGLTGYTSYQAIIDQLDTTITQDPSLMQNLIDTLATIYASELPMIPSHYNSFFYIVRTDTWDGWLQNTNYFQDPVTVYTNNKIALKTQWIMALNRGSSNINPYLGNTEPARAEIMYTIETGTFSPYKSYNPLRQSGNSYLSSFMYEPLYGYNEVTNTLINVIGSSLAWSNYGYWIIIQINPEAKWSDGRNITADDVVYSYQSYDKYRYPTLIGSESNDIFSNISALSPSSVLFELNTAWSNDAFKYITSRIVIIPQHVFSVAELMYGSGNYLDNWENNWFDLSDTPLTWQVCSGPYSPYWQSSDLEKTVFKRRADWWGYDHVYNGYADENSVPYIGVIDEYDPFIISALLDNGEIDLSYSFMTNYRDLMDYDPYIETYYGRSTTESYQSLGSVVGISMNHLRYPFVEPWFKQMFANAIDYTAVSDSVFQVTNIPWQKADTCFLNNESSTINDYYNKTLRDDLQIDYNYAQALSILEFYCYWHPTENAWFTKDVPLAMQGMLGTNGVAITDEDLYTDGFNVKLGGYEINVPLGWTDVEAATEVWATSLSALNISTIRNSEDMMDWVIEADTDNYDMMMQCAGPRTSTNIISYLQDFSNPTYSGAWTYHSTNWMNETAVGLTGYTTYQSIIEQLVAPIGRDEELMQENVNQLVTILATELPMIPSHYLPYAYIVRTNNWDGWLQNTNNFQNQPTINDYYDKDVALITQSIMALRQGVPITNLYPSAPLNLEAAAEINQIRLTWTKPSDSGALPVRNYDIFRGTASGSKTFLTTVGNVTEYLDTAVSLEETYYYQVVAVSYMGPSPQSNEDSATPLQAPNNMIWQDVEAGTHIVRLIDNDGTLRMEFEVTLTTHTRIRLSYADENTFPEIEQLVKENVEYWMIEIEDPEYLTGSSYITFYYNEAKYSDEAKVKLFVLHGHSWDKQKSCSIDTVENTITMTYNEDMTYGISDRKNDVESPFTVPGFPILELMGIFLLSIWIIQKHIKKGKFNRV